MVSTAAKTELYEGSQAKKPESAQQRKKLLLALASILALGAIGGIAVRAPTTYMSHHAAR